MTLRTLPPATLPPRMPHYDWVFFDAGDTLFSLRGSYDALSSALTALGYNHSPAHLHDLVGDARREALQNDHLMPGDDYAIHPAKAAARWERLFDAALHRLQPRPEDRAACRAAIQHGLADASFFPLFPDVLETLDSLRQAGLRVGVISNWDPGLDQLCHQLCLAERLDFVLASELVGYAKPGRHIFERALELAAVRPERAVMVGDNLRDDVLGASSLGIHAVLLDRGGYYPPDQWQPTIHSLRELPPLLQAGQPLRAACSAR
jgi:putative hydrolase of the HAD superfamily